MEPNANRSSWLRGWFRGKDTTEVSLDSTGSSNALTQPQAAPNCEAEAPQHTLEVEPTPSTVAEAGHPTTTGRSDEDFSDLDALGIILTDVRDKQGKPVLIVIAQRAAVRVLDLERLQRYVIHQFSAVALAGEYSVVWMHTRATYRENCPGLSWLWRTYERAPPEFRNSLTRLYILHCDMSLWVGMATLVPWFSSGLWKKVEWLPRVEFLHDYIDKRALVSVLPDFVAEHDEELEEQPLKDYGLVAMKVPGMPFPGS